MKVPLRYQISEYDCGPTSVLNGISFLFERERISPVIIRNIMLYSLDDASLDQEMGTRGTSSAAMRYLSFWLDGLGRSQHLPVCSTYLHGDAVRFGSESLISDALRRHGAVVLRILLDAGHYVLLTGIDGDSVYFFDPYIKEGLDTEGLRITDQHPLEYNRILPQSSFELPVGNAYALGPQDDREAVILYNTETMLTPENTIEYFI